VNKIFYFKRKSGQKYWYYVANAQNAC